jgi:hypothetical protein
VVSKTEDERDPEFVRVLESAARLQQVVPDAVLVGGSAEAMYAGHRRSFDHDHVLPDLRDRFDAVLEAIESEDGWVTNRVTPGKVVLGRLGDIEAGVRQMIRSTPLEVAEVVLPSGRVLRAPTPDETLRVKGFLIVRRNQTRDFLDVVALAGRFGIGHSGRVLAAIDTFYADQRGTADPRPKDASTTRDLTHYKGLARPWQHWATVVEACRTLAQAMVDNSDAP